MICNLDNRFRKADRCSEWL